MECNFYTDMQLLKKISLQAETVTFISALACHSNTNVSNSPAGSKLSQVMSLQHHPDEETGSFHHHCWELTRTAPALLHPYSRARKESSTGQISLSHIFPQAAMKGQKEKKNPNTKKLQIISVLPTGQGLQLPVFHALNIPT